MLTQLLKSKTLIFNALVLASGVLAYVSGHEVMVEHPEWVAGIGAAVGAINVVLRFFTTMPVSQK
jgi:hypothetical protein